MSQSNTLEKGIYNIPDGFMVKVLSGARQIEVKEYSRSPDKLHCRNCEYFTKGHFSPNVRWYESDICLKRPKKLEGYYYATIPTAIACHEFKQKQDK